MSFKIIFILTTLTMFNIHVCKSQEKFLPAMEGDIVHLNYSYPCNSTKITLQYGIQIPFYILADAETITLPPEQAKRFTFTNEREDDNCLLFVRIKEVSRTDAGTYLFFAYIEDDVHYSSFKMIGLHVYFLPGKALCKMNNDMIIIMGGDWVALDCIAPVGSAPLWIDCYQNGEKMPPRTDPIETNKYLKQTILAKKTLPVFCCSSTWDHTKDICECNDFKWDLTNDKNLTSIIDPCGPTTPVQEHMTRETTCTSAPTQGLVFCDKFIDTLTIVSLCLAVLIELCLTAIFIQYFVIKTIITRKKTKSCRMYHQREYPSPICHKSEEHKETATKENCELEMVTSGL